jgi:ABC-2 type transport system ATP-binding protein
VGAIVETPAFHGWLSGLENLRLAALYKGLSGAEADREIARVLERVGLSARAKDPTGAYSLGMRQRLALARTLLGRPRLLLLDEPTNGLDPTGMREVRDLVRSLALTDRITVVLSSHLLAEVQQVCNRVAILSEGRLKAEGAVSELLAGDVSVRRIVEIGADPAAVRAAVADVPEIAVEGPGGEGRLRLRLTGMEVPELVRRLVAAGVAVESVVPDRKSLEDVFVAMTSGSSP